MVSPQVFMGGAMALLCCAAFRYDRWFLAETKKGRRLVKAFGEIRAVWIWRMLALLGVIFGVCLATGIVSPLHWD